MDVLWDGCAIIINFFMSKFHIVIAFFLLFFIGCNKKSEAKKSLEKTIELHEIDGVKYPASITLANVLRQRCGESESEYSIPKIYSTSYDWQMNERIVYIGWSGYKASDVYINLQIETNEKFLTEINKVKPNQLFWLNETPNGQWLWQAKFIIKNLKESDTIKMIEIFNVSPGSVVSE